MNAYLLVHQIPYCFGEGSYTEIELVTIDKVTMIDYCKQLKFDLRDIETISRDEECYYIDEYCIYQ